MHLIHIAMERADESRRLCPVPRLRQAARTAVGGPQAGAQLPRDACRSSRDFSHLPSHIRRSLPRKYGFKVSEASRWSQN